MTTSNLTQPSEYAITNYREADGREGPAWSGNITLNGTKVATVTNDGNGGCNMYHFPKHADREAFKAVAQARFGEDAFEVEDVFADDLATRAQFNKKRSVLLIHDDLDVERGEYLTFKASATLAQIKAYVTGPQSPFAGKNPMLWDKRQSIFVPAEQIQA